MMLSVLSTFSANAFRKSCYRVASKTGKANPGKAVLYPPNVAIGIPPEPHELLRFFPIQMLHAFFQVNQRVAGITHIPMHILRHIYIYAAYGVHDFPEALQSTAN